MINKIKLLLLSWLVILPVGAFAQDYTITSDWSSYTPTTFSTDWWTVSLKSYVCAPWNDCNIYIKSWSLAFCRVDYESWISDIDTNTCDNKEINPWTYEIFHMSSMDYFDSITFSIVWEDSWAWVDSSSEWLSNFSLTLTSLVWDLTTSFTNYLPTLILLWFGVLVFFVFRWYIKHASVELFSMYKNRNKSEWRYQNEDVNAMYNDRKNDFVKNHDLNNAVSKKYYDADARQEIFAEDYFNNHDKYFYDELVYKWDHFFRSNKETWEEEELFTDWKWYKTWWNYKTWVLWRRFNVD